KLECAAAGGTRREDPEDDAFRSTGKPLSTTVDRSHSPHPSIGENSSRAGRIDRSSARAKPVPRCAKNFSIGRHSCGDAATARRKSGRTDESDRFSECQYHLQRSAERSWHATKEAAGLRSI